MDVGEYRPGFETVSARPSGDGAQLHARRPGAARTLCGVPVDMTWFAWDVTRIASSNGNGCAACRDGLFQKEVRA